VNLSLTVNNTGNRPGAEVVQVYVHDPISALRRPQKELKGFAKVVLDPGASEDVSIVLDKYAFSYWDDKAGCWVLEAGDFEVIVAKSSRTKDEVARLRVTMESTHHWSGL
jgi:beta-glucosidase